MLQVSKLNFWSDTFISINASIIVFGQLMNESSFKAGKFRDSKLEPLGMCTHWFNCISA